MKVQNDEALLDRTFLDYQRDGNGGMSISEREAHNAVRLAARGFAESILLYALDTSKRLDAVRAVREAQKIADKAIVHDYVVAKA